MNTLTLTGTYKIVGGDPASGTIEIIPSERLILDAAGNVVLSGRKKVKLDEAGQFSVTLPDPNDTTLNPNGFGYTVVAKLHHTHLPAVSFAVPSGTVTLDVADVTQVDPSTFTPGVTYATGADLSDVETRVAELEAAPAPVSSWAELEGKPETFKPDVTDPDLSATIGRGARRAAARGQGVICFVWDDGYDTWDSFMDLADSLDQRHTLAITTNRINVVGGVTSAEVADWHDRGHEIASHSSTHPDVATQVVGTRVNEYENSKTTLEAITGAGTVTSFIYPYGGRSETTDRECYGRYDRVVDYQVAATVPLTDRHSVYHIPRIQLKDAIGEFYVRLAASQPVVVTLALHNPGGNMFGGTPDTGVTDAEVRRLMQLAHDLGVPCVTLAEAFPAKSAVMGFSFEESGTVGGALWRPSGSGTNANTFVTPDTGIAGTRAGQITTINTFGAGFRQLVDVTPGRSYTLSGRARITAGTPTLPGYVRARLGTPTTYAGPKIADNLDASSTVVASSSDITSTSWTRFSVSYVVPQGVRMLEIQLVAREQTGITAQFDHIHFGPTELGAFG